MERSECETLGDRGNPNKVFLEPSPCKYIHVIILYIHMNYAKSRDVNICINVCIITNIHKYTYYSWISLVTFADGSDFQRGLQHIRKKNWVSKKTALWGVTITCKPVHAEIWVPGAGTWSRWGGSMVTAWSFLDPRKAKSLFYIWLHGSTCNLYSLLPIHAHLQLGLFQ